MHRLRRRAIWVLLIAAALALVLQLAIGDLISLAEARGRRSSGGHRDDGGGLIIIALFVAGCFFLLYMASVLVNTLSRWRLRRRLKRESEREWRAIVDETLSHWRPR